VSTNLMGTVKENGGILPDFDADEAWGDVLSLPLMVFSIGSNETFSNLARIRPNDDSD
jgi:hypothetical protein